MSDDLVYQVLGEFISRKLKNKFKKTSDYKPRVGEYDLHILENIYEKREPCEGVPDVVCDYLLKRLVALGVITRDHELTDLGHEIVALIDEYYDVVEEEIKKDSLLKLFTEQ